jgi:hypothetical protein
MSNQKPEDVRVNVTIYSIEPLKFDVEPVSNGIGKGPNGEITFKNDRHPGFNVYFDLVNPPEGYVFPPNKKKKDAVWSALGTDCPEDEIWDVLKPLRTENNQKTLVVYNANVAPMLGVFQYTLRVTKDEGANYVPLDPGGDNMNGPISRSFDSSALVIGIGSGLATAAALLAAGYLSGLQLVMR